MNLAPNGLVVEFVAGPCDGDVVAFQEIGWSRFVFHKLTLAVYTFRPDEALRAARAGIPVRKIFVDFHNFANDCSVDGCEFCPELRNA